MIDTPPARKRYQNPIFPPPGYLTVAEAARRMLCDDSSVRNRIAQGDLAGESFPRFPNSRTLALCVRYEEVERYLDAIEVYMREHTGGLGPAPSHDRPWNSQDDPTSTHWTQIDPDRDSYRKNTDKKG